MKNIFWTIEQDTQAESGALSRIHNYGYHFFYDFSLNRHGWERDDALLLITLSGNPTVRHGKTAHQVRRGSVTLFLVGEDHRYWADTWEAFWFHFYPSEALLELLRFYGVDEGRTFSEVLEEKELEGVYEIFSYPRLPKPLELHRAAVLLERTILSCVLDTEESHQVPGRTRLDDIASYIRMHPAADHSVVSLAKTAHMSRSHFAQLFKQQFGMSVHAYVIDIRMRRAKQLLEITDLTAAEIGRQVGYETPYNFYSAFKKNTGFPPIEYRKQTRI